MQDFFTANNIAIPADSNPISVQGDDKFTALKNMMFSTLNRINSQVGVLAQEAGIYLFFNLPLSRQSKIGK